MTGDPQPGGILACDPATVFGWAYFPGGNAQPKWGSERLGHKGDDPGVFGAALDRLLEARVMAFRPSLIVYESTYIPAQETAEDKQERQWRKIGEIIPGIVDSAKRPAKRSRFNPQTIKILDGLIFYIQTFAHRYHIPCKGYPSRQFCAGFLGRGNVPAERDDKKRAIVEACRLLGWWPVTSDEADALALGAYAEGHLFPRVAAKARPAGPLFVNH